MEIREINFFNSVIIFIYNIRRDASPGANKGAGSK